MERDYGKEIDYLKEQMENFQNTVSPQLDELRAMVMELLPNKPSTEKLERVHVMHGMHPDSRLSEMMEDLCYKTEKKDVSLGCIVPADDSLTGYEMPFLPMSCSPLSRAASQARYWLVSETQTDLRYCWRYFAVPRQWHHL